MGTEFGFKIFKVVPVLIQSLTKCFEYSFLKGLYYSSVISQAANHKDRPDWSLGNLNNEYNLKKQNVSCGLIV